MNTKEHNEYMRNLINKEITNKCGLTCDKCGSEMIYSDNMVLCSSPPQRNVNCVECGFKTTIVGR